MQKIKFASGEYYHIYNRGVNKQNIFYDEKDFVRFLIEMKEFNSTKAIGGLYRKYLRDKKEKDNPNRGTTSNLEVVEVEPLFGLSFLVEIICYCLNPNHYHFILKQVAENGISKFMHKLGTGYPAYFNQKYSHSGHLFQGHFRPVHIDTNEYLLWLSGYINGNVEIHKIAKAENYKWSSYQDYLGLRDGTLCNEKIILSQFKSIEKYKEYVKMVIKESGGRKEEMKRYMLE